MNKFAYRIEYLIFNIKSHNFIFVDGFKPINDDELMIVVENTNNVVNVLTECESFYDKHTIELEEVEFHSYDTFFGKVPYHSIEINIIYHSSGSVLRGLDKNIFKTIIDELKEKISQELKITLTSVVSKYIRLERV